MNTDLETLKEIKQAKCAKKVQQLNFLGHHLLMNGIDADTKKVKDILGFR